MTSVSPSSTRSTWRKKISSVSRNYTSSPQCSLITQLTTAAGPKAASVTSARATATHGAASSITASRSHSAPIGLSLRSTQCWEFTPQSTRHARREKSRRLDSRGKNHAAGSDRSLHHGRGVRRISGARERLHYARQTRRHGDRERQHL